MRARAYKVSHNKLKQLSSHPKLIPPFEFEKASVDSLISGGNLPTPVEAVFVKQNTKENMRATAPETGDIVDQTPAHMWT